MTDNNELRDTILDMEASLSTNLSGYSMWHYGADIHGITRETLKNAIEALKAQEAVSPVKVNRYMDTDEDGHWYIPETYDCGSCGVELHGKANYCHLCGRAVKWE